ncbi:MAG: HAD family hydrolase, partial [Planctomycetota bacterium]
MIEQFTPKQGFFVGVDSDGCVFDTMEVKHKECFIPNIIKYYGLASVSKYAREAGEFVNLYSKWRGINRFPALFMTLDLLEERPEVQRRGVKVPKLAAVRQWAEKETKLANPALTQAVESTGNDELRHCLEWSKAVNATIAETVKEVPPFPNVRESLAKLAKHADIIVVSATPNEA